MLPVNNHNQQELGDRDSGGGYDSASIQLKVIDPKEDPYRRDGMAKAAAPYVHDRFLASITARDEMINSPRKFWSERPSHAMHLQKDTLLDWIARGDPMTL